MECVAMNRSRAFVFVLVLLGGPARADNWPAWRGPHGTGVCDERGLPLTWGPEQHVRWKVSLPGPGNSTPLVWGDHVFRTQALDGGKWRAVLAFNRSDGKKLWQQEIPCRVEET